MSTSLGRELVVWRARLVENGAERARLRSAELRRELEELRQAGTGAVSRDPAELTAAAGVLEAENAALEAELHGLELRIAQRQQAQVDREIARRMSLMAELRQAAEAEEQSALLKDLTGLEQLLSGQADAQQVWSADRGVPWQWDSLPTLAEVQIRSSLDSGLLREVCDQMLVQTQELERNVGVLPERLAALAELQAAELALAARLAALRTMVGQDSARTFRDPALLSYYASDEGLSPQQTHDLIETRLQALCQDAVTEAAVWRIQDRPELARITHSAAR